MNLIALNPTVLPELKSLLLDANCVSKSQGAAIRAIAQVLTARILRPNRPLRELADQLVHLVWNCHALRDEVQHNARHCVSVVHDMPMWTWLAEEVKDVHVLVQPTSAQRCGWQDQDTVLELGRLFWELLPQQLFRKGLDAVKLRVLVPHLGVNCGHDNRDGTGQAAKGHRHDRFWNPPTPLRVVAEVAIEIHLADATLECPQEEVEVGEQLRTNWQVLAIGHQTEPWLRSVQRQRGANGMHATSRSSELWPWLWRLMETAILALGKILI